MLQPLMAFVPEVKQADKKVGRWERSAEVEAP
jgi:hypothetical protein